MGKTSLITKKLVVKNAAHDGYRRAGMAFRAGENILEPGTITCSQLAMLQADPRLAVLNEEGQATQAGTADHPPGAVVQGSVSDGVTRKKNAK